MFKFEHLKETIAVFISNAIWDHEKSFEIKHTSSIISGSHWENLNHAELQPNLPVCLYWKKDMPTAFLSIRFPDYSFFVHTLKNINQGIFPSNVNPGRFNNTWLIKNRIQDSNKIMYIIMHVLLFWVLPVVFTNIFLNKLVEVFRGCLYITSYHVWVFIV